MQENQQRAAESAGYSEGEQNEESQPDADGKNMRRIQIEGEDEEYQMDEQGNIFDLHGTFIGVANPDEIEELTE